VVGPQAGKNFFILKAVRLLAKSSQLGNMRADLTDPALKFRPVFSYLIVYDPVRRPIELGTALSVQFAFDLISAIN
jgi:hypothetical protein